MSTSAAKYAPGIPLSNRPLRTRLAFLLGAGWSIYILLVLFKAFFFLGITIYPLTHRAICAGAIVIFALLTVPAKRGADLNKFPWYDWLLIVLTFIGASYVAIYAPDFVLKWGDATPVELVIAGGFALSLMEAVRRTAGLPPMILAVIAFLYFMYSDLFPGFLMSTGFSLERATGWMYLSGEGIWGPVLGVVCTTVPGFILFGAILNATGASDFFSDLALACMGGTRGGPAKTAVLSSMLFGSLSGSVAANVATTGQITIPMMMRNGFSPSLAGAVESVASTGGMFTPPVMGATAFLIAEFLSLSYWQVCVGAFLPAVLFYMTLLVQVDIEAVRARAWGLPKETLPRLGQVMKEGWYYLFPFAVLMFMLGIMGYSAETSILYTLIALVACTCINPRSRLTKKRILIILEDTARGMANIIPICALIGIVVASLTVTGAGANLSAELGEMSGSSTFLMLLMAAVASFVLGMGMPALPCYLLTVTLIAPGLIEGGIQPLAAHMFLFFYGCLSFITPPVAVAAFVASGITGGDPIRTGIASMRLGLAGYLVPWAFVYAPALLWIGSPLDIATSFTFAATGLIVVSISLSGYFFGEMQWGSRLIGTILGLVLFFPLTLPIDTAMFCLTIGFLVLLRAWQLRRHPSPSTSAVSE